MVFGGKKRKQKGGAIPIGLLASVGPPILGDIAKLILGKIFGRGRKCRRRGLRPRKRTMREKIVLRRRTSPKVVTLPNGTTFTARYERINRKQLPINIEILEI